MKSIRVLLAGATLCALMCLSHRPVLASPGEAKVKTEAAVQIPAVLVNLGMIDHTIAVIKFSDLHGPDYEMNLVGRVALINKNQNVLKLHFEMDRQTVSGEIPPNLTAALRSCSKPVEAYFTKPYEKPADCYSISLWHDPEVLWQLYEVPKLIAALRKNDMVWRNRYPQV